MTGGRQFPFFILVIAAVNLVAACSDSMTGLHRPPRIALDRSELELLVGESARLQATLHEVQASQLIQKPSWFSSDTTVATVSEGLIFAHARGEADITATYAGASATAKLRVHNAGPHQVAIDVQSVVFNALGESRPLLAEVYDALGRKLDVGVVWSSSDTALVMVSPGGTVIARAVGTALAIAAAAGIADTAAISVRQLPAAVVVEPAALNLSPGDAFQLDVRVADSEGHPIPEAPVDWSSVDSNIASVDANGLVIAHAAGVVKVVAQSDSIRGEASVAVLSSGGAAPASVTVSPTNLSLGLGQSRSLTATVRDSSGNVISGAPITWTTSNAAVASVSANGTVTGVAIGDAVVTAHSGAQVGSSNVTVQSMLQVDPQLGYQAWKAECQQCHTGEEAWDLAHFNYADSTIVRRAVGHVDSTTAAAVVAYVHSLIGAIPDTARPSTAIYQPGGAVLNSDQEFGISLFGNDQWPASLTAAQLRAKDPRHVAIALRLPAWSNESNMYDWLPGGTDHGALPAGVKAASPALGQYYANPSINAAVVAAKQLLAKAHTASDGPCRYPPHGPADLSLFDPEACFDVAKWGASLIYIEGIRSGDIEGAGRLGTDHFWEVGHMSHKSQQNQVQLQTANLHTAAWIYLGWMWDHSINHNSLYGTGPLARLGLARHVTWLALRTMVVRNLSGSKVEQNAVCLDVAETAKWGHVGWLDNSVAFGYRYLLSVLNTGWRPPDGDLCSQAIRDAQRDVANRKGQSAASALQPLADSILRLLGS